MPWRFILIIILFIPLIGCKQKSLEISHPVLELFPDESEVNFTIELQGSDLGKTSEFLNPVDLPVYSQISGDSTSKEEYYYFSWPPNRIDVDPGNNIYIVQNHSNKVNVYDINGLFLYSIGREGRGPGEFIQINTFDFSDDYQKLYVLDLFKVEVFVRKEGIFEPHNTILLDIQGATDLCIMNDKMYVSGTKINIEELSQIDELSTQKEQLEKVSQVKLSKPIHRYDAQSGEYEFNFGFLYESPSGIGPLSALLTETMLSCNKARNTVIGVLNYYPFIFGYNAEGQNTWISKISDFRSIETIEKHTPDRGPVLSRYSNSDIFNRYLPIRNTDTGYSILQTIFSYPYGGNARSKMPDNRVRTILIDSETGELSLKQYDSFFGVQNNQVMVTVDIDRVSQIASFNIYRY